MEDQNTEIARRVAQLRQGLGLSQQALASAADVSISYIRNLEQGVSKRAGSVMHLRKLAGVLGVSVSALTGGVDDPAVVRLPFKGWVAAGAGVDEPASPGIFFEFPLEMVKGANCVYRVRGDSMRDVAILQGDYLVVREDATPPAGSIAVAWVRDRGAVVKRVRIAADGRYQLHSENGQDKGHYPYTMGEGDTFYGELVSSHREHTRDETVEKKKTKPKGKAQ